jgi:steroid delta-isomerase-like uncharacterized protein
MRGEHSRTLTTVSSAEGRMTREEIVRLFDRREAAYDDLDATTLAADYADDCVIESPVAGLHEGRTAAEEVLRGVFEAFPDMKVRTDRLVIDGDHVAQLVSVEGTDLGRFLGMEATGKSFRLPAAFFFELRGRRIVRERRIYDFTGLLVQIGVLKAKPI